MITAARATLAILCAGLAAVPCSAQADARLEQRLGEAWRWREVHRGERVAASFRSVHERDDGSVWVHDLDGLWTYQGTEWAPVIGPESIGRHVLSVGESEDGTVIASRKVLVGVRTGADGPEPPIELWSGDHDPTAIQSTASGENLVAFDGAVHAATAADAVPRWEGPSDDGPIRAFFVDDDGVAWCTTRTGVWRRRGDAWHRVPGPAPTSPLVEVRGGGGRVAFLPRHLNAHSVSLLWDGESLVELPLTHEWGRLTDALFTPDADLLVALRHVGLSVLREGAWHTVDRPLGFGESIESLALAGEGMLLATTVAGRLYVCDLASDRWRVHDPREVGLSAIVNDLALSSKGGVWVGTHRGVARWNGAAFVDVHLEATGTDLSLEGVTTIHETADGTLWVGSAAMMPGVLRFDGVRWHHHVEPQVFADMGVHGIREAPDGDLWFVTLSRGSSSMRQGAVVRWDGERWHREDELDGAPMDRVYDLVWTADDEMLLGGLSGIASFDGRRWVTVARPGPEPLSRAFALLESSAGDLWVGRGLHAAGVVRRRAGESHWETVTSDPRIHLSAASFAETADGRVWFASESGLFLFHSGSAHEVSRDCPALTPNFWPLLPAEDGRSLWIGSLGSGLVQFTPDDRAAPRTAGIELRRPRAVPRDTYAVHWEGADAWGFTPAEELLYRWRVDDEPWSPWETNRWDRRTLVELEPGEHLLEVQAMDAMGNIEATPRQRPVRLAHPQSALYWRNLPLPAKALLLLVPVVLVGLTVAWGRERLRRRRERLDAERARQTLNEQLHALALRLMTSQERERKSLSRDLHDDVGQLLTATCLHLRQASHSEDPDKREDALSQAHVSAARALEWVRTLSASIRPTVLDDLGLESAARTILSEFDATTDISVRWDVAVDPDAVSDTMASHVFRILKECLTNILRHARARAVDVDLEVTPARTMLRVSDNGVGFDPDGIFAADGVGILGMRERVQSLGGTFHVESSPGNGTTVTVTIPGAATSRPPAEVPRKSKTPPRAPFETTTG